MTTVEVGRTVVWVNEGTDDHTTTSDSDVWDSGTLKPGDDFSFTFTEPGVYTYFCSFHRERGMVGTIVVLDADGSAGEDDENGAEMAGDDLEGEDGEDASEGDEMGLGEYEASEPGDAESEGASAEPDDRDAEPEAYPGPDMSESDMAEMHDEPDMETEAMGGRGESVQQLPSGESMSPMHGEGMDSRDMHEDMHDQMHGEMHDRDDMDGDMHDDMDRRGYDRDERAYDRGHPDGPHGDRAGYGYDGRGYYVVRPGDTLSGIAWRLGVPLLSLAYANGIYNLDYIRYGEVLAVPGGDGYVDGYGHGSSAYVPYSYEPHSYSPSPYTYYAPHGSSPSYGYYPYAYGMGYDWSYGYSKPSYGYSYTNPSYGYSYAKPSYGHTYAKPNYGYGYAKPSYGYGYAKPNYGYGFGWAKKAYGTHYGWP
jgi:hypothetical protein